MTQAGKDAAVAEKKREKRTIAEIRESKTTGEKMVYMSVPDYTSAKWAEMAGVDVAVVGDSLAMIAHGHPSTIPATMDMMVMHAQAIRRGAPNTFVLGVHALPELQHGGSGADQRDALHAAGGLGRRQAAGRQIAGAYPQGAGRCRHPHRLAHRPDPAHHRHVRRLQDPGPHGGRRHEDPGGRARHRGRRLLHAGVRGRAGEDRQAHLRAADHPHHRHRRRCRHRRSDPALPRPARCLHRLQAEVHQALRQADRGGRHRHQAVHQGGEGGLLPRRRPLLHGQGGGVREVRPMVAKRKQV